ncbi:hypothetical protein [Vacuolonema iberomarrocanum]|uniref:hypothetical protein n=1 Tax=Vacuolonema iberomarrocanum TaxID=3454632 RepID=UPI001A03AB5E|nr:hypothetical protein [filamentous cyanobacterium LEGE 07170]
MSRLNDRAYDILAAEVHRLCQNPGDSIRADIVLERLSRFRQANGAPLSMDEMRSAVTDILPNFSERVLQRAANANRPSVLPNLGCLGVSIIGAGLTAGIVWLLNLPYPMIRQPVSRTMPIVLLPSYMKMDHDYRRAVALVEQADQLVNSATSAADIELGAERVAQAQAHLDDLPVWFLGYYPRAYCGMFGCSWRFTFDEYEQARRLIGRTEAVVFQESNALTFLETGTQAVEAAKQAYADATMDAQRQQAIASWQTGMDQLHEVPPQTLAGRMAATRLTAFERDYTDVTGILAGGDRTNTLISAAQSFAMSAAEQGQSAPHPATTWARIAELWKEAIARLEQVPSDHTGYRRAQELLAEYRTNLGIIEERLVQEQESVRAMDIANEKTNRLLAQSDSMSPNQVASQLQSIINDLNKVQRDTTVYNEAQTMLESANNKLQDIGI